MPNIPSLVYYCRRNPGVSKQRGREGGREGEQTLCISTNRHSYPSLPPSLPPSLHLQEPHISPKAGNMNSVLFPEDPVDEDILNGGEGGREGGREGGLGWNEGSRVIWVSF